MPFVYLTALDQFTPVSWLKDEPVTYKVNGADYRSPKILMGDIVVQSCSGMPWNSP